MGIPVFPDIGRIKIMLYHYDKRVLIVRHCNISDDRRVFHAEIKLK